MKKESDEIKLAKGVYLPFNNENDKQFVPRKVSEFKNVGHIIEHVAVAIEKRLPILLVGETGTGKTSLVRFLAQQTNNGFRRVNHNGGTTVDDIVGKILVNDKGTYWVDGVLIESMRRGDWYVADEINASSPEILFVYHSLLDDDAYVVLPENGGEIVRPHKNFRFFATLNPSSDYTGVKELNKALMSRFIVFKTDFPSPKVEAGILHERTGIKETDASRMIEFAAEVRASQGKGSLQYVLSTRDLIMWAMMYMTYKNFIVAAEMSIVNKVGVDDRQSIQDLVKLHFAAKTKTQKNAEQKTTDPLDTPFQQASQTGSGTSNPFVINPGAGTYGI